MNKRREFITQIGLLATGLMVIPSLGCMATEKDKKFGIQMYSLREQLPNGVEAVVSQIAKAGYSYVEGYGYSVDKGFWGLKPQEFKDLLNKYHLTCPASHYDFGAYEQSEDLAIIQSYIDAAKILKSEYVVVPHINPEIYKEEAKTKAWLAKLNKAAKVVKDAGLKLAYHNHDIEFYPLEGGKTAYDILLTGTDPSMVDFEMDIYWVVRAKKDPIELFKKYPGRFKMWHVKDMSKTNPRKNTEVGNGSIDFRPIFKDEKLSGEKYVFMEQENFDIDPYVSINKSAQSLKSLTD